jgi:hypothetical protein
MLKLAASNRFAFRGRALVALLVAVVTAALLSMGLSQPAFATSATGSLNFLVYSSGHEVPIEHKNVLVDGAIAELYHFNSDANDWELVDSKTTDATGFIESAFTGMISGDKYALHIDSSQSNVATYDAGGWWYGGTASIDTEDFASWDAFTATSGQISASIFLNPGFTLSGSIHDPDGGLTNDATEVTAYRQNSTIDSDQEWEPAGSAEVSGESTYSIPGLAPGNYIVEATQSAHDDWATRTFNEGQATLADAEESATFSGNDYVTQAFSVDVEFLYGGSISGTAAVDPAMDDTSDSLVEVQAFPLDSHNQPIQDVTGAITTDADPSDGSYTLHVAPGRYALHFVPQNEAANGSYNADWYHSAVSAAESTHVDVADASTALTGIDETIGEGLTIHGTISGPGLAPLAGIVVFASAVGGDNSGQYKQAMTDANGSYTIENLPPADYELDFYDPSRTYPSRFWAGDLTDGVGDSGHPTLIAQSSGSFEADFNYSAHSNLTVHVANKAGASLANLDVTADPVTDGAPTPGLDSIDASAVSGQPGTYQLFGLKQGQDYTLFFSSFDSSAAIPYSQYLGGSEDIASAQLYRPSGTNDSLDVTLASNASLSGVVSTTAGKGIKNVGVDLYKFDGSNWNFETYAISSSSGRYSFPNLATGSYTVEFFTAGAAPYMTTFAGGTSDAASATHVYIAPGKPAILSQKLIAGGSISGVVAGPGGTPKLPDISIVAIALQGTPGHFTSATPSSVGGGFTGSTGKFTISGLATGYYALSFTQEQGDVAYGDTFVNPVTDPGGSAVYHVTAGKATIVPGTINLPTWDSTATATFSGSVDTSGVSNFDLPDGEVDFFSPDGALVKGTVIQSDGSYTINLPPGTYKYIAYLEDDAHPNTRFAEEFDTVTLTANSVTNVNIPAMLDAPLTFITPPSIASAPSAEVGTTYLLNAATWNRPPSESWISYQWMRGDKPIYGAINASYTSQGADLNADLRARVTVSDWAGEAVTNYVDFATPVIESSQLYSTEDPTSSTDATGVLTYGKTAHATPGQWHGITGLSYSYQWIDFSTTPVATVAATTADFAPTAAEIGHLIQLQVLASKPGYTTPPDYQIDENAFTVESITPPAPKIAPKVTSKTVGTIITYTVTPGTWSVAGTTPTYEWDVNGVPADSVVGVPNAFTYDTSANPVHSQPSLTVKVGATKDGYVDGSTTLIVRKSDNLFTGAVGVSDVGHGSLAHTSDEVHPGETLSAVTTGTNYASDGTAPTSFSYQWQRSTTSLTTFASIAGATKSTYKVALADAGHQLQLVLTGSSSLHSATSIIETGGTATLDTNLIDLADGHSVGLAYVYNKQPGTKFSVNSIPWALTFPSATNSYQWFVCSQGIACGSDPSVAAKFTAIVGAKSATYTPPLTMAGKQIAVRVTGAKFGYATATAYSTPITLGDGLTIMPLSNPTFVSGLVGGEAKIGVKLTVKSATYNVPGVTPSYKWWRYIDGEATQVGTGASYTPNAGDFGGTESNYLEVDESATKTDYTDADAANSTVTLGLTATSLKVAPKVTSVAGSWVVSTPTWSSGVTAAYDWFVDGVDNTTPGQSFAQQPGSVTVVAYAPPVPGYSPANVTVVVQKGAAPSSVVPSIGGTPKFGNTLSVSTDPTDTFTYPSSSTPHTVLTYQWYWSSTAAGTRNAIAAATHSTFTPSTSFVNKWISVKLTATSPYYATASHLSTPELFTAGDPLTQTVTISSGDHPGSKAIAGLSSASSVTGQVHTYQWQTSVDGATWTNISGATKSSYIVLAGDLGKKLQVVVTTKKSGYTTAHDTSGVVEVVQAYSLIPTTQPTLTGNAPAGSTLTVNPGVWNVASTTYTYQWYRDGAIIPGVTGTTYTTTGDEDGEDITVKVTAHSPGYLPVTVSPADIQVTDGAAPNAITAPKVTGVALLDATLTATPGVWSLDDLQFTYQWQSSSNGGTSWTDVPGATSATYVIVGGDSGNKLRVVVTATRAGYTQGSAPSAGIAVPIFV